MLDEVNVGDFRMDLLKFVGEVRAGIGKGVREFCVPKVEEAVR